MYSSSVRSGASSATMVIFAVKFKLFVGVGFGVVEDGEHSLRWCLGLDPVIGWINHPAARADKGDAHQAQNGKSPTEAQDQPHSRLVQARRRWTLGHGRCHC